ncbi:MAG: hypothetical protein AVDCRST_MAG01-01-2114 [uncultured Rubrobacteraceae bacterium]|uniref:Uncharacterized protein n=1 Tax=uncultured Rubrobacteraceae bacterium TaxID=349277 RepID=A0A6J4PPS7_9ACTN|nr:MAG: hypothetical protein AVDCRST_MAG01-01-2114 [uncultured Rubrobacteraceae bacterium]
MRLEVGEDVLTRKVVVVTGVVDELPEESGLSRLRHERRRLPQPRALRWGCRGQDSVHRGSRVANEF